MEQRIVESEQAVAVNQAKLQDPLITADPRALESTYAEMLSAQQAVDTLYARWAELESKLSD